MLQFKLYFQVIVGKIEEDHEFIIDDRQLCSCCRQSEQQLDTTGIGRAARDWCDD